MIALSRQSTSSLPKNCRVCFELVYVSYTLETTSGKKSIYHEHKRWKRWRDKILIPVADAFHFVNRRIEKGFFSLIIKFERKLQKPTMLVLIFRSGEIIIHWTKYFLDPRIKLNVRVSVAWDNDNYVRRQTLSKLVTDHEYLGQVGYNEYRVNYTCISINLAPLWKCSFYCFTRKGRFPMRITKNLP